MAHFTYSDIQCFGWLWLFAGTYSWEPIRVADINCEQSNYKGHSYGCWINAEKLLKRLEFHDDWAFENLLARWTLSEIPALQNKVCDPFIKETLETEVFKLSVAPCVKLHFRGVHFYHFYTFKKVTDMQSTPLLWNCSLNLRTIFHLSCMILPNCYMMDR